VTKLNFDSISLGSLGSFQTKPLSMFIREDGRIDIEYSLKDNNPDAYKNMVTRDPFDL